MHSLYFTTIQNVEATKQMPLEMCVKKIHNTWIFSKPFGLSHILKTRR